MKNFKTDFHLSAGAVLLAASTLLFIAEDRFFEPSNGFFTVAFFFHYGLALTYFLVNWYKLRSEMFNFLDPEYLDIHVMNLLLFNISAYSLNKTMNVFHESMDWLMYFLIAENLIMLILVFVKKLPERLVRIFILFLGVALLFNIYEMLILTPLIPISILGIVLAGLSLLTYVPLFFIIMIIRLSNRLISTPLHKWLFSSGIALAILIAGLHTFLWNRLDHDFRKSEAHLDGPYENHELPDWIKIAQRASQNLLLPAYLKAGLVYQDGENIFSGFSGFGDLQYTDTKIHDPLVTISTLFHGKSALTEATRIKILNYLADARHESGERFWSGQNLHTKQITSNIELFPEERLAYTELILAVVNNRPQSNSRWRNQQEAFYTFQLPAGGVITSLSLWIEGKECKGYLTSKKKAETAYNTIVGSERRDPSVIYWMEGNQARVRVFPCTPAEDRKFKIGVTSPLRADGNQLTYESISFKGPDYDNTISVVNLLPKSAVITSLPSGFEYENGYYTSESEYDEAWQITMETPAMSKRGFSWKNEHFEVIPAMKKRKNFTPETVYLDVNSSWTQQELKYVLKTYENTKIKLFTQQLTPFNQETIAQFNLAKCPEFTLFPFHEITDPASSLVITKGGMTTPNLSDLEGSAFQQKLFAKLAQTEQPVLVLDLDASHSPYMNSLHELKVIYLETATINNLNDYAALSSYPDPGYNKDEVNIGNSGLSISKVAESTDSPAGSDHLMRLFYYAMVMQEIGHRYFTGDKNTYLEAEIVEKAEIANIVTPVSSLIVLESQADYDRFGITQNKDSLGNAAINHTGAVPEPHEWALIILGVIMAAMVYLKSRF